MDKIYIVRWSYRGFIPENGVYKDRQKALHRAKELNEGRPWYQKKWFTDAKYIVQSFDVQD